MHSKTLIWMVVIAVVLPTAALLLLPMPDRLPAYVSEQEFRGGMVFFKHNPGEEIFWDNIK